MPRSSNQTLASPRLIRSRPQRISQAAQSDTPGPAASAACPLSTTSSRNLVPLGRAVMSGGTQYRASSQAPIKCTISSSHPGVTAS